MKQFNKITLHKQKKLHTAATQHQSFQWRTVTLFFEILKNLGSYSFSKLKSSEVFSGINNFFISTIKEWHLVNAILKNNQMILLTVKLNLFNKFWIKLQFFYVGFYYLNIFPEYSHFQVLPEVYEPWRIQNFNTFPSLKLTIIINVWLY